MKTSFINTRMKKKMVTALFVVGLFRRRGHKFMQNTSQRSLKLPQINIKLHKKQLNIKRITIKLWNIFFITYQRSADIELIAPAHRHFID